MIFKKRHFQRLGKVFAATGRMMLRHEVPRDAAGISYFTLLALFPAILIILALADSFLGWMNPHYTIIQTIMDLFPGSSKFIQSSLIEITEPSSAVIISCIGVVLWSSSWIFTFIESSINRAWDIPNQRTFWESRLRTMALLALGSISLLSSAAITGFQHAAASSQSSEKAPYFMGWFWYFFLLGTGLTIAILVFALIYKWTPHCKVFWSEAFSGAIVATILWEIGGYIFLRVVPSFFNYERVYGKMGATIAILAWVYTSNMILLFGANFSAQLHWIRMDLRGSNLIPGKKTKPRS
jgi:membrane protein